MNNIWKINMNQLYWASKIENLNSRKIITSNYYPESCAPPLKAFAVKKKMQHEWLKKNSFKTFETSKYSRVEVQ